MAGYEPQTVMMPDKQTTDDVPPGVDPTRVSEGGARTEEQIRHSESVARAYRRHMAAAMTALEAMDGTAPLAARDAAMAELERAVAERDAFFHAAAHDLRNPLTALRGQAQLLGRRARGVGQEGVDAARVKRSIDAIEEATERTAILIDRLLDADWFEEAEDDSTHDRS